MRGDVRPSAGQWGSHSFSPAQCQPAADWGKPGEPGLPGVGKQAQGSVQPLLWMTIGQEVGVF